MIKKIILSKDGKNKLEITWSKPWDMLMKMAYGDGGEEIPIESNWHANKVFYRTFKNVKSKAEELKIILGIR